MLTRKPDLAEVFIEGNGINDASVSMKLEKDVLRVFLKAELSQPRYVKLRWSFTPSEKRSEPVHVMEEGWERGYGTLKWRGIDPGEATPWAFAVSNGTDTNRDMCGRYTECFGVKVRPNAMCFWQYDHKGVTLWADVRNGGAGVKLMGRELMVCEVIFREYRDTTAFRAVNSFFGTLCDDPLVAPEKIYGANNWYYAYGHFDHQDIVDDAKLISSLCEGLENRPYMVIDAGWESGRHRTLQSNSNCPDMKKLADDIAAEGAKPGIWVRYLIDENCGIFPRLSPQRMARDTDYLDPSHPDVLDVVYEQTDQMVNDWGYRLIKHDFSTFDIFGRWGHPSNNKGIALDGWHFFDETKTTAEIIKNFYAAILNGTKGKCVILGCNVIGHLAAGYVHANRTGDDTSGRYWDVNRRHGVNALAFHMVHNRNFYAADPDCVGATDRVPWNMNREWLRAVGCSGNTLFLSIKPGVFTEEQYDEMRRALAVNSVQEDVLEPIDWMETVNPTKWLLNGEPVSFNWVPEEGSDCFNPCV